jgi:hypothetical protein
MRTVLAIILCWLMIAGGQAMADETVGAIWVIDYKQSDREQIKIRCLKNGKVLGPAGKEIGTWKQESRIKSSIEITAGANRNGKYEFTRLNKNPPSFQGRYTDKDGAKVNITVKLVKD